MIRVVIVTLLAACGRVGFEPLAVDARVDAAILVPGHDEDGDGIEDALDFCPHIAAINADFDGDGVGDACDPNPGVATERFTLFTALTPESEMPFDRLDDFTQGDDYLESAFTRNGLHILVPVANSRIELGFEILARNEFEQKQIAMGPEVVPFYFIELNDYDMFDSHHFGLTYANPGNGYDSIGRTDLQSVHVGVGSIRLDTTTSPPTFFGYGGWVGEMYEVGGDTPNWTGAPETRLVFGGVDIRLRYIVQIDTN